MDSIMKSTKQERFRRRDKVDEDYPYMTTGQTRVRVTPDDSSVTDEDIRVPLHGKPGERAKQGAGKPYMGKYAKYARGR
jgi:hypothetical protein